MKLPLLSIALICQVFALGQFTSNRPSFTIFNSKLQPISDASIYFPKQDLLTSSDLSGTFFLPEYLGGYTSQDSLIIMAQGFEQERITLKNLQETQLIILNPLNIDLTEVEISVKKKKSRYKKAGNKRFSESFFMNWYKNDPDSIDNYQIGQFVSFKTDSIFLEKLVFHIHSSSTDTAEFILEVFEGNKDSIGQRLHPPLTVISSVESGWNEITLTQHLLRVPKQFWISINYIPKKYSSAVFHLNATLFSFNQSAIKPWKNRPWKFSRGNPSIYMVGRKVK